MIYDIYFNIMVRILMIISFICGLKCFLLDFLDGFKIVFKGFRKN